MFMLLLLCNLYVTLPHNVDAKDEDVLQPSTTMDPSLTLTNATLSQHIFSITSTKHGSSKNQSCEKLFSGESLKSIFSPEMLAAKAKFDDRILELTDGKMEGHSGDILQQTLLYFHLARLPFVSRICEIGFNAGHSAFIWLAANPHVHLVSFDLGVHPYTRAMGKYLRKQFRHRFDIRYGNSVWTVPRSEDLLHGCDLLVVDGSHSYSMTKLDLINMRQLATIKQNLVVLDDYPCKVNAGTVGKAWLELQHNKRAKVKELYSCYYGLDGHYRGHSIGTYIFSHDTSE